MSRMRKSGEFDGGRITAGIIVAGLGLMTLIDHSAISDLRTRQFLPGFAVLVFGLVQMTGACRHRRGSLRGVWLVLIGAWLIVNEAGFFGLHYRTSWPLLLIAVGLVIVVRETYPDRGPALPPKGQER
jgi:4-amino-4-deoxy-L-arabinose transferase-like glycosyltransferase